MRNPGRFKMISMYEKDILMTYKHWMSWFLFSIVSNWICFITIQAYFRYFKDRLYRLRSWIRTRISWGLHVSTTSLWVWLASMTISTLTHGKTGYAKHSTDPESTLAAQTVFGWTSSAYPKRTNPHHKKSSPGSPKTCTSCNPNSTTSSS